MRAAPWQQRNWDIRAAGNFIGGGSGAGTLIAAGLAGPIGSYRLTAIVAIVLIAAGLLSVLAEIGRPRRAINVLRHPKTSWMTREAMIAPFLFIAALAAAIMHGGPLSLAAALFAAAYLYAQARMLQACKGIPCWRQPASIRLMIATGLLEGTAIAALLATLSGIRPPALTTLLLVLLVARQLLWQRYLAALGEKGAPEAALQELHKMARPLTLYGLAVPAVGVVLAFIFSSRWLVAIAAVAAMASGWALKLVLITKAGYNQGAAMPNLPIRGVGDVLPGVKPGWKQ